MKHPLWEPFLLMAVLLVGFKLAQLFLPGAWTGFLVPAALLYAPFFLPHFRHKQITFLDRTFPDYFRSLKFFFIITLAVMPPFMVAAHFWMLHVFHRQGFEPASITFFTQGFLTQLIAVALPEEFFFRGYFQEKLGTFFKPKWKIFGVSLGYAWPLTAIIFSFAHSVIHIQWWHFSIFFPALLFGWLREKTGSITAPILFHTFCNCWTVWFTHSYGAL